MSQDRARYTVGIDYGTLSGRAVVVRVSDGAELGSAVHEYPHGVMDRVLTAGDGRSLPPEWALQHPQDYVEVLRTAAAASGEGEELQILLVGGGDLVLLHSHEKESAGERNSGWMQRDGEVRTWASGTLRPLGERILPEARRGIPRGWRFDVPTLGASATLHATGFISEIGAERTGRRGVEVRYTLEGWLTLDGSRVPVRGAALYRVP